MRTAGDPPALGGVLFLCLLSLLTALLCHAAAGATARWQAHRAAILLASRTGGMEPPGWEAARILWFEPMDANLAGFNDLRAIPGIGARSASAFLALRDAVGGFLHRDQWAVDGYTPIGPSQRALLAAYLAIDGGGVPHSAPP